MRPELEVHRNIPKSHWSCRERGTEGGQKTRVLSSSFTERPIG